MSWSSKRTQAHGCGRVRPDSGNERWHQASTKEDQPYEPTFFSCPYVGLVDGGWEGSWSRPRTARLCCCLVGGERSATKHLETSPTASGLAMGEPLARLPLWVAR